MKTRRKIVRSFVAIGDSDERTLHTYLFRHREQFVVRHSKRKEKRYEEVHEIEEKGAPILRL